MRTGCSICWSPDKQLELLQRSAEKWQRFLLYCGRVSTDQDCPACIEPQPKDNRFGDPAWRRWPFNLLHQGFLLTQQWWQDAATGVPGVFRHHEEVVSFVTRQLLDSVSPSNFPPTNPVVLEETARRAGANFLKGAQNLGVWPISKSRPARKRFASATRWRRPPARAELVHTRRPEMTWPIASTSAAAASSLSPLPPASRCVMGPACRARATRMPQPKASRAAPTISASLPVVISSIDR